MKDTSIWFNVVWWYPIDAGIHHNAPINYYLFMKRYSWPVAQSTFIIVYMYHLKRNMYWLYTGLWNTSSGEVTAGNQTDALHVGDIQVSVDSTLDDLKLQVMTLPAITDLGVPMAEFLRVRVIEDGRLATILKGESQTLR